MRRLAGWRECTGGEAADAAGKRPSGLIAETLEASRLLGKDSFLVLHGGGNTSVKSAEHLWAKASGFDLAQLGVEGLVQLDRAALATMLEARTMSDLEMMAGYEAASLTTGAPPPTIETLVHHVLPFRSVLHTHADAIVALTDTDGAVDLVREVLGDDVIFLPFVMPGFELARAVQSAWEERRAERCTALVLAHHGLFTMGDEVADAYGRHVELVEKAEAFLERQTGWRADPFAEAVHAVALADLPRDLREAINAVAPAMPDVAVCADEEVRRFLGRGDLVEVSQRGPTTLEHVIRTKRVPMLGRDVEAYVAHYSRYFERHAPRRPGVRMLDPTPRVILDPELGLVTTGPDSKTAHAVMDIYRHTIRIIEATERLGGYRAMTEAQAFDIEYWELEQRRLRTPGAD